MLQGWKVFFLKVLRLGVSAGKRPQTFGAVRHH